MYKVLNLQTGDVVYTSAVLYVMKNPASGAWIRTDEDDAEAVSVAGQLFNLPSKPAVEGLPTAIIRNLDGAAAIQAVEKSTDQNSADVNTLINAVCDVNDNSDLLIGAVLELNERLEAIENG